MTVKLHDVFDWDLYRTMRNNGYVSQQRHPDYRFLAILNYTPAAQYEGVWNPVTSQCRGLIYNTNTYDVVARPFAKFFNYEEVIDKNIHLPAGDPVVTENMDGSLGIIYTYNGNSAVATRGSFASDQAKWASENLAHTAPDFIQPDGVTTLVEIIYPANRIVVDYSGMEGLWLLGAIDNDTGADIPIEDIDWWNGPVTYQHGVLEASEAVTIGKGNSYASDEGVVLTWYQNAAPSIRLKVKHPRYVALHRVVTNLSTRSVHEALANDTFDELLEVVPDEFHPWLHDVENRLRAEHRNIVGRVNLDLLLARLRASDRHPQPGYTRPLLAEYVKNTRYPGLCFALEDGKSIDARVWDMIRPEREMAVVSADQPDQLQMETE